MGRLTIRGEISSKWHDNINMSREDSRHCGRVGRRTGLLKCSSYLMLQDTDCWKLNVICAVSWSGMNAQPILATNICLGSTIDECSRLLRGSRPEKALWAMAGGDPEHHQHGGQVLLAPWCTFDHEFHRRLILGDTFNATSLRQTAKEMLLANSKKLDLIPDWRKKLSTRTELTLEVLGELARNSLWSRDILVLWHFDTWVTRPFHSNVSSHLSFCCHKNCDLSIDGNICKRTTIVLLASLHFASTTVVVYIGAFPVICYI